MQYSVGWVAERPLDAAARLARAFRGPEIVVDDSDAFRVSVREWGDHAVSLGDIAGEGAGRARFGVKDSVIVTDVVTGSVSLSVGGRSLDVTRPVLIPPGVLTATWAGSYRARIVRIRRSALDGLTRGGPESIRAGIGFPGSTIIGPLRESLWRSAERHAREVASSPDLLRDDLVWEATARLLISTVLAVFPGLESEATDEAGRRDVLPLTIRRALAYMEDHIAAPVRVADVAAAARLSPRGLQSAFQRALGHSPTEYLRLMRLEGARTDLLRSDRADGVTVQQTARRWGFTHVPRFASAYRARYGESPHETLLR